MISAPDIVINPQAEALLDEVGVSWRLEFVEFRKLDIEESLHNQARIVPLNPDRVTRYKQSRLKGAEFPAVLIAENGSRHKVCVDGNHRIAACKEAGDIGLWAYVFSHEDGDGTFRAVADTANARLNGAENTLEERLMHASYHIDQGIEIEDAATLFGVSKSQIQQYRGAMAMRERFAVLGIGHRSFEKINDRNLSKMSIVADDVVRDYLRALNSGVRPDRLIEAIRDANKRARTEAERISFQREAIETLRADAVNTKAGSLVQPQKRKRDTRKLRLTASIVAIKEALEHPTDELNAILEEIRALVCRS